MYDQIRVKGQLDLSWQTWFTPLQLAHEPAGTTLISSSFPDQAALYGLLLKLDRLGLTLIAVACPEAHPGEDSPAEPT